MLAPLARALFADGDGGDAGDDVAGANGVGERGELFVDGEADAFQLAMC